MVYDIAAVMVVELGYGNLEVKLEGKMVMNRNWGNTERLI
jgi:hypothetical protein